MNDVLETLALSDMVAKLNANGAHIGTPNKIHPLPLKSSAPVGRKGEASHPQLTADKKITETRYHRLIDDSVCMWIAIRELHDAKSQKLLARERVEMPQGCSADVIRSGDTSLLFKYPEQDCRTISNSQYAEVVSTYWLDMDGWQHLKVREIISAQTGHVLATNVKGVSTEHSVEEYALGSNAKLLKEYPEQL